MSVIFPFKAVLFFPGKAVKKELPPIGDISIKGIVNIGGFMEMLVLQNTRLHISYAMAEKLSRALLLAAHRYSLKKCRRKQP
ncbi:DUF1256 domain-containing protein [Lysinibacillus sp. MHQ-1]|nr:DUF1256 domain-containing protein [Lysinibacillus sp. MHQ-1]